MCESLFSECCDSCDMHLILYTVLLEVENTFLVVSLSYLASPDRIS